MACFRPFLFLAAHQPLLTSADGYRGAFKALGRQKGKSKTSGSMTGGGESLAPVTAVVLSPCDQDHRQL